MTDYTRSIAVAADADRAFDWMSDVSHLPQYFESMTSAQAVAGDEVHVTARIPDGRTEEGEAWFRTDQQARRIEWGSENPDADYSGWLEVAPDGSGCTVTLGLHMVHDDVDDSIGKTLQRLKERLEG